MIGLVGLPGSGKSTVGRHIARRLQLPFFDSDHVIEERMGYSIREAFERDGEDYFRDLEESVLDELTQIPHAVISTGGVRYCVRRRDRGCTNVEKWSISSQPPRSFLGACGTTSTGRCCRFLTLWPVCAICMQSEIRCTVRQPTL
jgi:hypothetical protein